MPDGIEVGIQNRKPTGGLNEMKFVWIALSLFSAPLWADPLVASGEREPSKRSSRSLDDLLRNSDWGQLKANLRYRYEYVDEEGRKEAEAQTFRLRLGYLTPLFHGLQGYVEMEGNFEVGLARYNSLRKRRNRSVIADPQETELNQAWLKWEPKTGFTLKVGRQRIVFDDHRFIGNVGWRQLEQTYDAVRLQGRWFPETVIDLVFLWRVQNVLSRTVEMTSPLLHIDWTGLPFGQLTLYGYWLDYKNASDSQGYRLSSQTYGVRFVGRHPVTEKIELLYQAEYARQMDYRKNPLSYQADYYRFAGGVSAFGVTLQGGIENLTADRGQGFATPLATLHAFQGWADRFLKTPPEGVRDLHVSVSTRLFGFKLLGVWHDFHDENGRRHYGEEFDAQLVRPFGQHVRLLLKYAYFNATGWSRDTQKVWGQVELRF